MVEPRFGNVGHPLGLVRRNDFGESIRAGQEDWTPDAWQEASARLVVPSVHEVTADMDGEVALQFVTGISRPNGKRVRKSLENRGFCASRRGRQSV